MAGIFGLSGEKRQALLGALRGRPEPPTPPALGGRLPPGEPARHEELRLKRAVGEELGLPDIFFLEHEGMSGPVTRIAGRDCVNFMSYDYCGFNRDPRVQDAAIQAVRRHGISAGASRVNAGARPPHAALERAIAAHYGAEDAVVMVSGHATNVTSIASLFGKDDLVLHDALAHNSVVQGCILSGARRLVFPHNDLTALERMLVQGRPAARQALIAVEGHFGMDGDTPDLAGLIALAWRHDAYLMVDEAHALGTIGTRGGGIAELCGVDPVGVDIWMGTLSKTLAGCGGYIAGSRAMVDYVRNFAAGFVYSVGIPSPVAAAALKALELLHAEPERVARLQSNSRFFLKAAREAGLDTGGSIGSGIVPVIVNGAIATVRAAALLFERGIFLMPVLPPGVPDRSARLRFFITEGHTQAQLADAVRQTAACLAIARAERIPLSLKAKLADRMRAADARAAEPGA